MILCLRTNNRVAVSPVATYSFYDAELDEDLYMIETYLDVSQDAKDEAKSLKEQRCVPENFSNDSQLSAFIDSYLKTGDYELAEFKKLDVLRQDYLEYDQAVLLATMYTV